MNAIAMSCGPFCYGRRVWSTSFPFSRTTWGKDSQPGLEVLNGAKSGGHSLWMNRAKECSIMEQNHPTIRSVPYSSTIPFSFISTRMLNTLLEARCWDLRAKVMGEGGGGSTWMWAQPKGRSSWRPMLQKNKISDTQKHKNPCPILLIPH